MKNHLVSLLLEQFKQEYLVSRLDELGIEMQVASIDITSIVYDMVGLPPDNTACYSHPYLDGVPEAVGKKMFDSNYCSRYWLSEKYQDCIAGLVKNVRLSAVSRGLTFECEKQEKEVKEALSVFVDWLYEQAEIVSLSKQEAY